MGASIRQQLDSIAAHVEDMQTTTERLWKENERMRAALTGITEYCSGDKPNLSAIGRLASIRNTAERALADANETKRSD